MWDPEQYLRYAGERGRPFFDLISRVQAETPSFVADLGCGPGNLTAVLAQRWPGAEVLGIDNSPEMIGSALAGPGRQRRLSFELADVRGWQAHQPVDVIVSNAVLQWVPDHLDVIAKWPAMLSPGGWLAFQLPGNFDQPTHAILLDLVRSDRWQPLLSGVRLNRQAHHPGEYLDLLAGAGCRVDAWETTYLHVLAGPDPVVEWYRGTGLRPVLAALGDEQAEEFVEEYGGRVRAAYPAAPYGTVLPFRRVFVVAQRPWSHAPGTAVRRLPVLAAQRGVRGMAERRFASAEMLGVRSS
jgi:trans-aconitate 2-methyltransferase